MGYSKKVKELRSEIEGEKRKHAASVSGLNERIGQQVRVCTLDTYLLQVEWTLKQQP